MRWTPARLFPKYRAFLCSMPYLSSVGILIAWRIFDDAFDPSSRWCSTCSTCQLAPAIRASVPRKFDDDLSASAKSSRPAMRTACFDAESPAGPQVRCRSSVSA